MTLTEQMSSIPPLEAIEPLMSGPERDELAFLRHSAASGYEPAIGALGEFIAGMTRKYGHLVEEEE